MTNSVKVALIGLIKQICPNIYSGKSAVVYPKTNLWIKQIEDSSYRSRYAVTLDFFTKGEDSEDSELLAEKVEKHITMNKSRLENGYMSIYKSGSGGLIEYKDSEKISHYTDSYEVIFYKEE